jgi:plastocyanin
MTNNVACRFSRPLPVLALAAALAFGTVACGGDKKGSEGSGATGTKITIKDFAYEPNPLRAKVGDTITVTNDDGTKHTLTADDNSLTTGELKGGASATVTLKKAGTLAYHCEIHGQSMKGSIRVAA